MYEYLFFMLKYNLNKEKNPSIAYAKILNDKLLLFGRQLWSRYVIAEQMLGKKRVAFPDLPYFHRKTHRDKKEYISCIHNDAAFVAR